MSSNTSPNTLREHLNVFKHNDELAYNKFVAALAGIGQSVYLNNTLCRKADYDLREVRFIVADKIIEHLSWFGFRHFRENELPNLPERKIAES